jgi:glycerol kinase
VLEGIAYQVGDLLAAMERDVTRPMDVLRVDGGASVSDFMMQFQADILQKPIDRPYTVETTALGAAFLAGLSAGVWERLEDIQALRRTQRRFEPAMEPERAKALIAGWHDAVSRARSKE